MSIKWKGAAVALLLAAGSATALAQSPMPGPGQGPGAGPRSGYGMGPGYGQMHGPWGGQAFGRYGKRFAGARLDALRHVLKITEAQSEAWNTYAKAVTDAQQGVWTSMGAMMRPGTMYSLSPDQRFAFMQRVIELHKKAYDEAKQAAGALLPHLTPYQKGQASVLLPGLANTGFGPFGYGRGHFGSGWGMMGGFGGGYGMMGGFGGGYGMMGY